MYLHTNWCRKKIFLVYFLLLRPIQCDPWESNCPHGNVPNEFGGSDRRGRGVRDFSFLVDIPGFSPEDGIYMKLKAT